MSRMFEQKMRMSGNVSTSIQDRHYSGEGRLVSDLHRSLQSIWKTKTAVRILSLEVLNMRCNNIYKK